MARDLWGIQRAVLEAPGQTSLVRETAGKGSHNIPQGWRAGGGPAESRGPGKGT